MGFKQSKSMYKHSKHERLSTYTNFLSTGNSIRNFVEIMMAPNMPNRRVCCNC